MLCCCGHTRSNSSCRFYAFPRNWVEADKWKIFLKYVYIHQRWHGCIATYLYSFFNNAII